MDPTFRTLDFLDLVQNVTKFHHFPVVIYLGFGKDFDHILNEIQKIGGPKCRIHFLGGEGV